MLCAFNNHTLYRHSADHISAADLTPLLHIPHWEVHSGQHWAVIGGQQAQRTELLALLKAHFNDSSTAEISPAAQQYFIEQETIKAKTGVADEIVHGTKVLDLLLENNAVNNAANNVLTDSTQQRIQLLGFENCLQKYFRQLSSGETRRLLILLALQNPTDVLLLQDPLEGLDVDSQPVASALIESALENIPTSIFAASRPFQLLATTTHIAYIENDTLQTIALDTSHPDSLQTTLATLEGKLNANTAFKLPALPDDHPYKTLPPLEPATPLVSMRNVRIAYADSEQPVFDNLNWQVKQGEHWRAAC